MKTKISKVIIALLTLASLSEVHAYYQMQYQPHFGHSYSQRHHYGQRSGVPTDSVLDGTVLGAIGGMGISLLTKGRPEHGAIYGGLGGLILDAMNNANIKQRRIRGFVGDHEVFRHEYERPVFTSSRYDGLGKEYYYPTHSRRIRYSSGATSYSASDGVDLDS